MKTNRFVQVLQDMRAEHTACASVNILNYNTARAVIHAAQAAARPIILQPSTGTVRRYGVDEMFRMVDGLRRGADVTVVLHLDHCRDVSLAKACIEAGWDSVMMDYSALSLERNILLTREMADYAHQWGVAVEGEVGIISGVEDDINQPASMSASFEDTVAFIEQTGVDAIAPAIGTAHGVYRGVPQLNYTLMRQLSVQPVPVVVHGGTGLPKEDFQALIALGAAKINLSTVLKQLYLSEMRIQLQNAEVTPIDLDLNVETTITASIERYIRLFAGEDVTL